MIADEQELRSALRDLAEDWADDGRLRDRVHARIRAKRIRRRVAAVLGTAALVASAIAVPVLLSDDRERGDTVVAGPDATEPEPATTPATNPCPVVPFLPTWLPDQWTGELLPGRGGDSGVYGVGHWDGTPGSFIDVVSGETPFPFLAGTATQVTTRVGSAEVGEIHEGYNARIDLHGSPIPCALWHLEGYGLPRSDFERVIAGLASTTAAFAIWPEDTAAAAAAHARSGIAEPWREQGDTTVLEYAAEVLGWTEATVTGNEPSDDGRDGASYSIEREPGGLTLVITAAPLVDGRSGPLWSVYGVGAPSEADLGASISVGTESDGVYVETDRAHASAELRVGHGGREVTATAPTAEFEFDLPYEIDASGHVLVIWRDEAGRAVGAWGFALPAQYFAAG